MPDLSFPAVVPWRERPHLPIPTAASLIGCSRAKVYSLAQEGRLDMVKLAGRTLITTATLCALIDSAKPYRPDGTDPRGLARTRAAELAQHAA